MTMGRRRPSCACNLVLTTSSGHVTTEETRPAQAPAMADECSMALSDLRQDANRAGLIKSERGKAAQDRMGRQRWDRLNSTRPLLSVAEDAAGFYVWAVCMRLSVMHLVALAACLVARARSQSGTSLLAVGVPRLAVRADGKFVRLLLRTADRCR